MKRSGFKQAAPAAQKAAPAKQKKCKVCGCQFTPVKPLAVVCGALCAIGLATKKREKTEKTAAIAERKLDKEKLDGHKAKPVLVREAQTAFNAYIRARDEGLPCICCGRFAIGDNLRGGLWDAGHYRSRGSAPHLRFDERNVHRQLKQCNIFASGNALEYRIGMINRFGLDFVEAVEADNEPKHYTIDDLKRIKAEYSAKTRELKKGSKP